MYVNKFHSIQKLFSPYTYLVLMWLAYMLTYIESGLSWGLGFEYYASDYFSYFFTFTCMFIFGAFIVKNFFHIKETYTKNINTKILWLFLIIAVVFQLGKFINIGDIPLIGNPMSRYNLTLGGYEDYPSRLLAPIGLFFFLLYMEKPKKSYLFAISTCLLLPLLLMQRQEVLILLLGCLMAYARKNKISVQRMFILGLLTLFFLVFGISLMTIARYGADTISGSMSIFELVLWILHGELTTPLRLGAFVDQNTENLNGLYTFGTFLSILIPGFKLHGAEYIRTLFSDSDTAQSVGSLFGFAIDFGLPGVAIISFITSLISFTFYEAWKKGYNFYFLIFYPVIFLQLLWNLRSGTFVFNPLIIYVALSLIFILNVGKGNRLFDLLKILYIMTLPISLLGLLVRI